MIDTIKVECFGKPKSNIRDLAKGGWVLTRYQATDCTVDEQFDRTTDNWVVQHKETKARLLIPQGGGMIRFEGSLPKLLHGRNSEVITSNAEVDKAWDKMETMVDRFVCDSVPINYGERFNVRRVDPAWHVDRAPIDVIDLHRFARHPRVRKATQVFDQESVHFPGVERRLRIYDKGKEAKLPCGSNKICRVELQLTKDAVRQEHGLEKGRYLAKVNGEQAYQILRKFCLQFQDIKFTSTGSLVAILSRAQELQQRWSDTDELIVETYLRNRSKWTRNRMMKKILTYQQLQGTFSWNDILPEDHRQAVLPI